MTFSFLIALGAAFGLAWIAHKVPPPGAPRYIDAGLWALLGGLMGGRLVHTAVAWPYYAEHPIEIPQIWLGGISGPGCAWGALLAVGLYAVHSGIAPGILADALLPLVLTVTVSAWLACWLDGCAYGAQTDGWWGVPARDEWGQITFRLPVQFLGALITLLIFWVIDGSPLAALVRFRTRARKDRSISNILPLHRQFAGFAGALPGVRALCVCCLLCLEFLGLSFLRADPLLTWRGLRLDTWAWAAFTGLFALLLFFLLVSRITKRATAEKGSG